MRGAESGKKLLGHFGTKFCSLIGYQVEWGTKTPNPFVEYRFCYCGRFLIRQGDQLDILGEGIRDTKDKFLSFV